MTYETEFGDYDEMYGSLDYEGAVVLDVGADYGSTARYFLERGAQHVYASEKNEDFQARLIEWAETQDRVAVLPAMTTKLAEEWLRLIRPDVVKIDCEGCERFLLEVPDDFLVGPRAWVVETHTQAFYDDLTALFRQLGYEVTTIKEYGPMRTNPDKVVNVFKAVRDD